MSGEDGHVIAPRNSFVSWCRPGIPFFESDFDFAVKGLESGQTAEEQRELNRQGFEFAVLVDFVPNTDQIFDDLRQENVYRTAGDRLSEYYGQILVAAKVAKAGLT